MWHVDFTDDAMDLLRRIPAHDRKALIDGIQTHLAKNNPAEPSRNKFKLRRPSALADYELRLGAWRVFYRIDTEGTLVTLVGRKVGNTLIVGDRRIEL